MTRICIICGAPAGSKEHLFPAAFGGKRTNQGIYCENHNNSFGRHTTELLNALDVFNSAIGVIPDRKKEIRPAQISSKGGEQHLFAKDKITLSPPPPLHETPELVGKPVEMKFANQDQANKWIAQQEKAGFEFKQISKSPVKTQIVIEPMHATKEIGNEPFMRALIYLALTFLAHNYPDVARSPGLANARHIVENDGPVGDLVLWEPPNNMGQLDKNPFRYGHTVAIGPISQTGQVGALISLFGALHFGVTLGEVSQDTLIDLVTTHIDPLATQMPQDLSISRESGSSLSLSSVQNSKKYLQELREGRTKNPITALLQSVSDEELFATCNKLLHQLMELKVETKSLRTEQIYGLLTPLDQRIFNLIQATIRGFGEYAADLPTPIHNLLAQYLRPNDDAARGLDGCGEAGIHLVKWALSETIMSGINDGSLNEVFLADLLGGAKGTEIVLLTLLNPISQHLRP